jgi:vanillate O-demethylase monooxygenase subunit
MYPLKASQPYPLQQWWMIGYGNEFGREPVGRTLLGQRVVLYRQENGEPVVLSGICPHRMFPLERGQVVGDALRCGYHGFTYDASGRCIQVPSQEQPAAASLRRYPVLERGTTVWVWSGDPERADPALMPDLASMGIGAPGWGVQPGPDMQLKGRYTLLIDNLLDLTHITFIHAKSIPYAERMAAVPWEAIVDEKSYNLRRIVRGLPASPFLQLLFPDHQGPVDQYIDAEYFGPHLIRTGGEYRDSHTGRMLGTMNFVHCITPQTPTSTHYWPIMTHDMRPDDPAFWELKQKNIVTISPEDAVAIAALEEVIGSGTSLPPEASVRADVGSIQVRRRLEAQIQGEAEAAALQP